MATVRKVTAKKSNITGRASGENGALKLYTANAQLPAKERTIPVSAASAPKKKYSKPVINKICLRLAPKVRSNTLSCIR